ncbi:MAG: tyrosine-type recombinase/integrase [Dehalococcoidia bacterium]|nr:tyrosine-type recombinase/integrase [Dehalococcoidia bacterium]
MENQPSLATLLEGFRLSCHTEGKSRYTIEWYLSFLDRFRRFLESAGEALPLGQIDRSHIRAFIRYLQTEARTPHGNAPLAPATVQAYVRALKALFAWATREEYLATNPMDRIPLPKIPVKVISTFSTADIERLAQSCQRGAAGERNLCMIMLLFDTGIRVSELIGIEMGHVDLELGQIKITHPKGGRERLVPIGSLVQRLLWRYIQTGRPRPLTDRMTALFLTDRGLPFSRNGVQQMLRRCGRRAGLGGVRCSPHTLRHTFARNYLLNGGDIFSLQKILGHASLASVRMYVNLFSTDIKKQHQRFSPADNLVVGEAASFWRGRQAGPPRRELDRRPKRPALPPGQRPNGFGFL